MSPITMELKKKTMRPKSKCYIALHIYCTVSHTHSSYSNANYIENAVVKWHTIHFAVLIVQLYHNPTYEHLTNDDEFHFYLIYRFYNSDWCVISCVAFTMKNVSLLSSDGNALNMLY